MALNGKQAYAIAKKYTNDTVIGLGGIKGKNCIIQSAIKTNGITDVIFQWTDNNDVVQTTSIQVADGKDGIVITNVDVNEFNHLICTLSDGTIIDAGEIQGSGSYALPISSTTTLGGVKIDGTTINIDENGVISSVGSGGTTNYSALTNKPSINGVELTGDKSTIDLGIDIPTVTNDLTNELKSEYDQAVADSHTHENKELLGTYTQTEANLANAVGNSHIHSNKTVLDNTTASYTTAEKTKLNSIEAGAKVNIQANWEQTDNLADDYIKNKPTSLPASDVSTWAKATDKPTYSQSEIGLGNVPNVTTNDQTPTYSEASTLATLTSGEKMSIAFGKIKKAITSLISHTGDISNPHSVTKSQVGLGNVDNTSDASKPISTATQTALDTKASTTTLTTHTGNADIHVTAADKTAWNNKYVLPTATTDLLGGVKIGNGITITDGKIGSTCTTKTYGKAIATEGWYRICDLDMLLTDKTAVIMLNRNYTNAANEAYIISFCYSHNKPVFNLINSSVGSSGITKIRVVYNSNSAYNTHMYLEVYYALNVLNTVSSAIFYNSVEAQQFIPVNFTAGEIPAGYGTKEFDLTNSKLLSFSPVPATLTSSGTIGDIAYDANYLYMCTATNTWKKTAWGADVYSTTETVVGTYMGKPLYRKVVDCGALPNSTTKEILHNIANINIITKTSGISWINDGITIPLPAASTTAPVSIYGDKSKIYIITTTDRSTFTNSNVTLEYTKTTDA